MDVYVDGALIVPALSFGEVTRPLMVSAGEHQVALRAQGSDPLPAALVEVSVRWRRTWRLRSSRRGAPEAVEAALYEDILDEIDLGLARLTAINAVPNSPALEWGDDRQRALLQGVNYGTQFGTV